MKLVMKKCPFCNADIAENARFCLYCMKPLNKKTASKEPEKKRKWWLIILTAVLLLFVTTLCIFLAFNGKGENKVGNKPITNTESNPTQTEIFQNSEAAWDGDNKGETVNVSAENINPQKPHKEEQHTTEATTGSDKIPVTTKPQHQNDKNEGSDANTNANTNPHTSGNLTETKSPPDTTLQTTKIATQNNTITNVRWNYRSAYSGDYDKRYNKVETKDAIVITGIKEIAPNGIYKIPQTIDGKTVVAIDMSNPKGYSFNSGEVKNGVRKVYLPPKLNKIANGTFSECVNLADLYVSGEYLYVAPGAFSAKSQRTVTLKIHSSESAWCLYGAKYFDVYCSPYGPNEYYAVWEEWVENIYS